MHSEGMLFARFQDEWNNGTVNPKVLYRAAKTPALPQNADSTETLGSVDKADAFYKGKPFRLPWDKGQWDAIGLLDEKSLLDLEPPSTTSSANLQVTHPSERYDRCLAIDPETPRTLWKPKAADWEHYRSIITKLNRSHKLSDVVRILKQDHGFNAT